jgi:hypothetical protein
MQSQSLKGFPTIALLALVAVFALPVFADTVDYSTCAVITVPTSSGTSCGLPGNPYGPTVGNSYSNGIITLTLSSNAQPILLPPLTGNTPFDGNIVNFAVSENASSGSLTLSALPFSIYIYQTMPGTSGGTLAGSVSGTVVADPSGDFVANFAPGSQSLVLGGITYSLDLQSGGQCAAGDGCEIIPVTPEGKELTAFITGSAVPEPAFYALTGLGFAGLLGLAARRRRQSLV